MEEFAPLIIIAVLYLCFFYPLSKMKKAAKNKSGTTAFKSAANAKTVSFEQAAAAQAAIETEATPGIESIGSEMSRPMEKTESELSQRDYRPFGGDADLYRGSLNAETGEGEDPCHEEQMESLRVEPAAAAEGETTPGMEFSWTGSEIVKGFVMSEVLKKRA